MLSSYKKNLIGRQGAKKTHSSRKTTDGG